MIFHKLIRIRNGKTSLKSLKDARAVKKTGT